MFNSSSWRERFAIPLYKLRMKRIHVTHTVANVVLVLNKQHVKLGRGAVVLRLPVDPVPYRKPGNDFLYKRYSLGVELEGTDDIS